MQGARNSPRMDEDPVGPRHWVAGSPVGYKHGMRDAMGARGQDRAVARAAQQPLGIRKSRDAGIGPMTGCGKGERDNAGMGDGARQATAPWDWETSRHGVVNHEPTMGSLATGNGENPLNSGTAVRCPQG